MKQYRCPLCDGTAWVQVKPLQIDELEYLQVARCRCSIDPSSKNHGSLWATRQAP